MDYSINPYQGCEHGCVYCYARNSHEYWGFSAGLDFESRIIVKPTAPALLRQHFENLKWQPAAIGLSGNTDCYQPAERNFEITRKLLEVFLDYRNPVGIITKNRLILRDLDLLKDLAANRLVKVTISITSLDEELRRIMEPRTATVKGRLDALETLAKHGIPVGVNIAPVIPGLSDNEIPQIMKAIAERGAAWAGYTIIRLNGSIGQIFTDWVRKQLPDRAEKILKQIAACHEGKLNDSRFGSRMKGDGEWSAIIKQLFETSRKKFFPPPAPMQLNLASFRRNRGGQLDLFG